MLNFFTYEFSSLYFMKILLLGDYSNVHATLASALRTLGHEVTLASDGDSWKNYPRDVDLKRPSLGKFCSTHQPMFFAFESGAYWSFL